MNLGLLTCKDDPLLEYYIRKIKNNKKIKIYIFESFKKKSKITKDKKIFEERTGSFFKIPKSNKKNKFNFKSHNSNNFRKKIKKLNIDYLFNSGTPNKIKESIIKNVKGIINIHPGLLPKYRGSTCVEWALYNKDPIGITAHMMTNKYDAGPVILKKIINLKKKDNYKEIRIKVFLESINLLPKIIKKIEKKSKFNIEKKTYRIRKIIPENKYKQILNLLNNGKYKIHKKNLSI